MSSDHELIAKAIAAHGDQLGGNIVHLKRFLQGQREAQEAFLAEQRQASDRAQDKAHRTATLAMIATALAAVATGIQAYVAISAQAQPSASLEGHRSESRPLQGREMEQAPELAPASRAPSK